MSLTGGNVFSSHHITIELCVNRSNNSCRLEGNLECVIDYLWHHLFSQDIASGGSQRWRASAQYQYWIPAADAFRRHGGLPPKQDVECLFKFSIHTGRNPSSSHSPTLRRLPVRQSGSTSPRRVFISGYAHDELGLSVVATDSTQLAVERQRAQFKGTAQNIARPPVAN